MLTERNFSSHLRATNALSFAMSKLRHSGSALPDVIKVILPLGTFANVDSLANVIEQFQPQSLVIRKSENDN